MDPKAKHLLRFSRVCMLILLAQQGLWSQDAWVQSQQFMMPLGSAHCMLCHAVQKRVLIITYGDGPQRSL